METPSEAVARIESAAARQRTPCGGGSMVWRRWGAGPPLVLLHGAAGSWTHWIRNVEALARRVEVIVPDLPGFGDSDMPPGPYTAESLAGIVAEGLDLVVPPPAAVHLGGFSFGGIVAGLVAARPDARVATLALVGPNGLALPMSPIRLLRRLRSDMAPAEIAAVHRENLGILMLADPERVDDLAVHLQTENVRRTRVKSGEIPRSDVLLRALPRVKARVCGIWGGRDALAVPRLDERRRTLARVQPGAGFRVVEGAGHWAPYEAPDAVTAALLELVGAG